MKLMLEIDFARVLKSLFVVRLDRVIFEISKVQPLQSLTQSKCPNTSVAICGTVFEYLFSLIGFFSKFT